MEAAIPSLSRLRQLCAQTPQTPTQLLAANANVQAPLIGYAIVGGYYPASSLTAGLVLTTTDYVQGTDMSREPLTITVQAGGVVSSHKTGSLAARLGVVLTTHSWAARSAALVQHITWPHECCEPHLWDQVCCVHLAEPARLTADKPAWCS